MIGLHRRRRRSCCRPESVGGSGADGCNRCGVAFVHDDVARHPGIAPPQPVGKKRSGPAAAGRGKWPSLESRVDVIVRGCPGWLGVAAQHPFERLGHDGGLCGFGSCGLRACSNPRVLIPSRFGCGWYGRISLLVRELRPRTCSMVWVVIGLAFDSGGCGARSGGIMPTYLGR